MSDILYPTISLVLGIIIGFLLNFLLLKLKRKNANIIFLASRLELLNSLIAQYNDSVEGDVIWGQCVGCSRYSRSVRTQILEVSKRGVSFKIIVNAFAPSLEDFRRLFDPIKNAQLITAKDNTIRIQGLSEKNVVVGFPVQDIETIGIIIQNKELIKIIKSWYDKRFNDLIKEASPESAL